MNRGDMALEQDFDAAWSAFVTGEWLSAEGQSEALRHLAEITAASFKTLAAQIDQFRSNQGAKSLDLGK